MMLLEKVLVKARKKLINTLKTVGVLIVVIALIILIVPKLTKKKNKIEESKEPLY